MNKLQRVSLEIHQAQEEAKRTKDLNYRKFNRFIVEKGIEKTKAHKDERNKEGNRIIENACHEAARDISNTMKRNTSGEGHASYLFEKKIGT